MDTVAGDDAVGGPFVFDLEHHAFVGLVGTVEWFCDDPVQAGAFELLEPLLRRLQAIDAIVKQPEAALRG